MHLHILLVVFFSFKLGNCNIKNSPVNASDLNRYGSQNEIPYQAQLIQPGDDDYFCGAAIISKTNLLTAASCIKHTTVIYQVLVGSTTYRTGQVHTVYKVTMHPDFKRDSFKNDIALLKLKQPLHFDKNVNRIALATKETWEIGVIYHGFGSTYLNSHSSYKTFELMELPSRDCEYDKKCASCPGDRCDSCQAHSGEMLVRRRTLVGIVSRPSACIDPNSPISFTRIVDFLSFIHREAPSLSDAKKKKSSKEPSKITPYYIGISKKSDKGKLVCAGALISDQHFVTADKCMSEKEKYVVHLGNSKGFPGKPKDVNKMKSFGQKRSALAEAIKLAWIAVKQLRSDIPKPLLLPNKNEKYKEGAQASSVGHGISKADQTREFIQHNFPVFVKFCKQFGLGKFVDMCAQDRQKSAAPCKLDSGSPVVMGNKLIGIVPMINKKACKKKMAIPIVDLRQYVDKIIIATKNLKE